MKLISPRTLLLIYALALFTSCATVKHPVQTTAGIRSVKFLGQYELPYNMPFKNTTVGGLSGIDYDAQHGLYYLVSDDRSDRNPARFYTAHIYITSRGIDSVQFTGMRYMLQPNGMQYPNKGQDRYNTPDPESMRYNPVNRQLTWSSEGERIVKEKDTVLVNPSINCISTNGKYRGNFTLPENLAMQAIEKGPRQNSVLEGICYADNYNTLFTNVEEPLYEDGPRADLTDNDPYIRLFRFDVKSKMNTGQYAYKLAPSAFPANPPTAFKINGASEILSIGNNKLLVVERSYSTGRLTSNIKVFIADLSGASDVRGVQLKNNKNFTPASKTLLLNMDELGIFTDNIEGVTFGPVLPNGNKTLLFVADNNFTVTQRTQFLLFEVIE